MVLFAIMTLRFNPKYQYIKALVLVAVLLLSACRETVDVEDSIRVGLITYTDMHEQSIGLPTLNAAQLAVEEVNAAGGLLVNGKRFTIELVVEGIASSPQNAVAVVRKMTNRELVVAIVGLQYSLDAIPAGAFAERAGVPFISPMSTHRLTTADRDYVFRMSFIDELQGAVMAQYAYHDLAARRAAILFNRTDPYSTDISNVFTRVFTRLGGEIVASLSHTEDIKSYNGLIQEIGNTKPDVLYLPGFAVDVVKQVRELRRQGFTVQLLGADGWDNQAFAHNPDFEGSYLTHHWSVGMSLPGSRQFIERYKKRFNKVPSAVSALTYDSMKVLFEAMVFCGKSDSSSIRQAIIDMPPYDGVSGRIDYLDSGDPFKGVAILQLQEGDVRFKTIVSREEED